MYIWFILLHYFKNFLVKLLDIFLDIDLEVEGIEFEIWSCVFNCSAWLYWPIALSILSCVMIGKFRLKFLCSFGLASKLQTTKYMPVWFFPAPHPIFFALFHSSCNNWAGNLKQKQCILYDTRKQFERFSVGIIIVVSIYGMLWKTFKLIRIAT